MNLVYLYVLSQQMQRQQQLLELKAHVHSPWSQHVALRLPTPTGSAHCRVRGVAGAERGTFSDGV